MDDPPFYREDLQAYYDLQIATGKSQPEAIRAVKSQFKVRSVIVTPVGEVRSPGVVDNPDPPEALSAMPPEGGEEGAPPEDEAPGSQIGDEDPHGKDAGRGAEEAGPDLPGRCEIPDAVWREFLQTDGDLDEFERWALDTYSDCIVAEMFACWEAPDLLEHWRPANLPKRSRSEDSVRALTPAQRGLYERFTRLVNMRTGELRAHLRSNELREMVATSRRSKRAQLLEGRRLARGVLCMKSRPVREWDEDLWTQCRNIVSLIERTRRNTSPLLDEHGAPTRKLFSLRSLGHNPTVRASVTESEIEALLGDERALHRYLDTTPGAGLVELRADDTDDVDADEPGTRASSVSYDALKKERVTLSPDERTSVMDQKAIWHHGPKGEATPAVWKSNVGGRTSYVTNTHRCYQVRSTLKGAISAYHKVVKKTA